jgi:membrane-associated protease RseP (regulator of RpoE activity)
VTGKPAASILLAAAVAAAGIPLASGSSEEALPRAGDLGLVVADRMIGDHARVVDVDPSGPAAFAGLARGDQIVAVDGERFKTVAAFERAIAEKHGGDVVRLVVRHAIEPGHPQTTTGELTLSVRGRPRETGEGLHVDYDAFVAGDARLRSVVTRPEGEGPWPAVLIFPDFIRLASDDDGPNPDRALAHELTRRGYLVMRYDQRGVGDSQGASWGRPRG